MSSTILMVIVLSVMWLVVLVPMFVRRHDDLNEVKSMDRFAHAMRVLSRRTTTTRPHIGPHGRPDPLAAELASHLARSETRARMLARRRRTFTVLAATTVVGLIASLFVSAWFWLVQAPSMLMFGGFVAYLREQVRREHAARAYTVVGEVTTVAEVTVAPAVDGEPVVAGSGRERNEPLAPPERDSGWRPVPVPVPTYVTAPPAFRNPANATVELDDDDPSFVEFEEHVLPGVGARLNGPTAADRRRAANE